MAKGNVLSSARVRLAFEGVDCFYCYGVDIAENFQYEPIEPLDTLAVVEHVPIAYRIDLSARFVQVMDEPLRLHRGIEIFPRLANVLQSGELTGVVLDRITGRPAYNITGVKGQSRRVSVQNRAILMVDATFVARKVIDESEI